MNTFAIVTDSSCDFPAELADKLEICVLPLAFQMENREYHNKLDGSEMSPTEFYQKLRAEIPCTTSAVNMDAFLNVLEPILEQGQDVLCPLFSSGLSATYQAGKLACDELTRKYPDRKIYAVDTLSASLGQGLLIWHAAQQRKEGKSIDEVRDWLESNKLHLCHWFTVEDLHFLKRGGRVSSAAALFGTMLGIKPVMHVDDEGHLIPMEKVRGRRASLDALVHHMELTATNPKEQTIFISHGDSHEDAEYVARQVREKLHVKDVVINYVGPVIGAHSGPGTIALFFLGHLR